MNTKRQYKIYSTAFRSDVLALISEQGYTLQETVAHWSSQQAFSTAGKKTEQLTY